MPPGRPIPSVLSLGPFRLADAEIAGVSRSQLRGARYSRPLRGVHAVGDVTGLADRCAAAAVVLPAAAAFSHWTAAALLGLPSEGSLTGLHVTVPAGSTASRRPGVIGHVKHLHAGDTAEVRGVLVTTAARTYVDLAERASRSALLGFGDAALRAGLATSSQLLANVTMHAGCRGVARARELLDLLDARAESSAESALRLLLFDAGLPRPEVNANVYDVEGVFLARADLLFRGQRVIVEYDGDQHRTDRAQFAHDVRRGSRLAAAGYLVLRFTAADLFNRPNYVVATVRAALRARG